MAQPVKDVSSCVQSTSSKQHVFTMLVSAANCCTATAASSFADVNHDQWPMGPTTQLLKQHSSKCDNQNTKHMVWGCSSRRHRVT